jgi:glycerol-3-phosphate dehydrogenase (NAD(P)+)
MSALVIGAGAFGTSIASVLCHNFKNVFIKVRKKEIFEEIKNFKNETYLPGVTLNSKITPILEWNDLDSEVELIISGLPMKALTQYLQENQTQIQSYLKKGVSFINLAKGISHESLELPDDLLENIFPEYKNQFFYLSGPSFAKEIIEKQITMVSLAGSSKSGLKNVIAKMETPYFKLIPTQDIKGVLLGGALKNVLAIAGGLVEGLGFNHNTRAAMITRGFIEMLRFGEIYLAKAETFYGPSGIGDLILTTTGNLSRNKQFGIEIAKGRSPDEIIANSQYVVEGYLTTKSAYELSRKYNIRAQLFTGIYQVLFLNEDPKEVIKNLMELPVKI